MINYFSATCRCNESNQPYSIKILVDYQKQEWHHYTTDETTGKTYLIGTMTTDNSVTPKLFKQGLEEYVRQVKLVADQDKMIAN